MKLKTKIIILFAMCVMGTTLCNAQNNNKVDKNQKVELKTDAEKAAYALGVNLMSNFQRQGFDTLMNIDLVVAGLKDQHNGTALIKVEDSEFILQKFFQDLQMAASKPKIDEGKKFLAENGKRKGVMTTASGLQYEVITMGKGEKPTAESTVKVHYEGTLLNGTVFDSSYRRNEPIEFGLNQVIRGWTEGVQLMPIGSKFKFFIPYDLGYGENGGGPIGPYETLIFEVELLDIVR